MIQKNESVIKYKKKEPYFSYGNLIVAWGALTIFISAVSFAFILEIPYIILIGVLLIVGDVLVHKRFPYKYSLKFLWPLLAFFVIYFLGVQWSMTPEYGASKAFVVLGWSAYFALIAGYIKDRMVLFLKINALLFFVYIVFLMLYFGGPMAVWQNALQGGHRLGGNYYKWQVGTFFNPIWLSRYIGVLILSFFLLQYQKKWTLLAWFSYPIGALFLLAAASKGPIIALIVSVFVFLYIKSKKKLFRSIFLGGIVFATLLAVSDIGSSSFIESRFSLESSSTGSRLELIEKAFASNSGVGSFFLGIGTGSLGYVLTGFQERYYPHNIIAELFGENGIFGLTFFLLAMYFACRKINLKNNQELFSLIFFVYFFMNAQFSGDLMFNQFIFMFYFILIVDSKNKYLHKR